MAEGEKTAQERFRDEVAKISQASARELLIDEIATLNRTGDESYWGHAAIAVGLLYVGDQIVGLRDDLKRHS